MTLRLLLRTFRTRPVRAVVLACGFGFGIAVMAALLGVGQVVLEQARSPDLQGGGDLVVTGGTGELPNARFLLAHVLGASPLRERVAATSPLLRKEVYLVREGSVTPLRVQGGIPSLERALRDRETSGVAEWRDAVGDREWTEPDPAAILRAMDRFHPVPDAPARASSWAEWLYFNARSADGAVRLYATFLAGPPGEGGLRRTGVRLQLERGGARSDYSAGAIVDGAAMLRDSPDLDIGGSRVRLDGLTYRIRLALPAEDGGPPAEGEIELDAVAGRALPPVEIRGARGWLSGYTVPVLSGPVRGRLRIGDEEVVLDGGTGYHDHNWGFWEGVTWQWGQVAGEGLSFVYGRVRPPEDAADPDRMPGFLVAIGPDGPEGFALGVKIEEAGEPEGDRPRSIRVRARGARIDLAMEMEVVSVARAPLGGPLGSRERSLDLLQMRGSWRVEGTLGDRRVEFTAPGSAETFRGR